jgi:polyvinyl alcohol dehydrogenase (cytochrome)
MPAIDPDEGLIYVTTGNSYSAPVSPYSDAILAVNLKDGTLRWSKQVTPNDWSNSSCKHDTPGPNCEGEHGRDLDFGTAPLLYMVQTANGSRKLVAAEQKSGVLYALDALTGEQVWQRKVGEDVSYAWGMAYDGKNFYVSDNSFEKNGSVYAFNPATGDIIWQTSAMPCTPGPTQAPADCWSGFMAAAVSTPGLVWLGAMDGQLWALDSTSGKTLWNYNTTQKVMATVNGVPGHGGSIGPANVTVANGQVYVTSGYAAWTKRMLEGNVLYVFGMEARETF